MDKPTNGRMGNIGIVVRASNKSKAEVAYLDCVDYERMGSKLWKVLMERVMKKLESQEPIKANWPAD